MGSAIGHGFRNLFNFQGRDSNSQFWFYILFICIFWIGLSSIGSIVWMTSFIMGTIETAVLAPNMSEDQAAQAMFVEMANVMTPIMWANAALSLVAGVFTIAAFIRRLHDSDLSGYWSLLPYGMMILSLVTIPYQMQLINEFMSSMPEMLEQAEAGQQAMAIPPSQHKLTLMGIPGWIQIISFIILAVRSSTRGPNRFGDEPVQR